MIRLVPIVEGDGEVDAVPILLREVLAASKRSDIQVARPKNAHGRSNLVKDNGVESFIRLAWKERGCRAILILLDAEGDCAKDVASELAGRAASLGLKVPVAIVCANRQYESWFLASLPSDEAQSDMADYFESEIRFVGNCEDVRSPKRLLTNAMPEGRIYKETLNQASLTQRLDHQMAFSASRSFQRLHHAVQQLVDAIEGGDQIATPS